MMRITVRLLLVLLLAAGSGPSAAQEIGDSESADLAAALAELEAAGVPPTNTEMADIGSATGASAAHGELSLRLGKVGGEAWSGTGRGQWRGDWWNLHVRVRQGRTGERPATVAGGLGRESCRMVWGRIGLQHGFGLLVDGPGRGTALTADRSLFGRSRGLRRWLGAADARTVSGVAGQVGWRRWRGRGLVGRRRTAPPAGRPTIVGQLARLGDRWRLEALVVSAAAERGLSLAGRWQGATVDGSFEVAVRQPPAWRRRLGAWLSQIGWRPRHTVYVELLSGWSDRGPRPAMGAKQPVLGDWSGRGLAWRATWRPARGLGVKVLVQQSAGHGEVGDGPRRRRYLSDVQVEQVWPGGWFGTVRVRRNGAESAGWSARFPWLPPAVVVRDSRRVTSATAGWGRERDKLRLQWRQLVGSRTSAAEGADTCGARSLLSLDGSRAVGRSATLRGQWSVAWGEELDLVSAVVPFAGYVLPRHWSHWLSEQVVGLELGRGSLRSRAAVSRRQAAPAGTAGDSWSVWLEGSWNW